MYNNLNNLIIPGRTKYLRNIVNREDPDFYSKSVYKSTFANCCNPENNVKNFSSITVTENSSNYQKNAQIIKSAKGGRIQFGNFYLGEPLMINYLGYTEGQSGGGRVPIRNRF